MISYPKRLIEVDLPIKKISAHARREKSIRHGHISTLHIWWARRPLAACRAVLCAALWPDPADPLCPQKFREDACRLINEFAAKAASDKTLSQGCSHDTWKKWQTLAKTEGGLDPTKEAHWNILRFSLLDFIADFADWDNSTVSEYLETSRALTQSAHEALGGAPGTRPLVVDPFAGGGSIPLEALRVGADTFASDLNPIPVLLNKVVLEYIPKYGQRLGDEVRKWGDWIRREAEKELAEFYPQDADGARPIAYLWARTILSDAPSTDPLPVEVPLLSSMWLSKKPHRGRALRWVRGVDGKVKCDTVEQHYRDGRKLVVRKPLLEVFEPSQPNEVEPGTVRRGSATCPVTGFTTQVAQVRVQLQTRKGGTRDARLVCVVTTRSTEQGRFYRAPTDQDIGAATSAECALTRMEATSLASFPLIPHEEISLNEIRRISIPLYGTIVFASKTTASWEAILKAVIDAGWIITGSWPIDTEREARMAAIGQARLASSVHIVCRPRENTDGSVRTDEIGDWRDVLQELPRRIHEWMPRLAAEGVVGADAIFACLGPALEIFSRYSRVEKPNGDQVTLKEYLEYVWAAVSKEAISMIFAGADTTGFEEDARLTAMWLWTLSPRMSNGESAKTDETEDADGDSDERPAPAGKLTGFTLEYDAARKIAQGLGAHLELLVNLVEIKGETARLLPVAERTKALFGKEGTESPAAKQKKSAQLALPGLLEELEQEGSGWTLQNAAKPGTTTLDRLHQAMILFAAGRGEGLRRFLVDDGVGKDQKFWSLAQSLCALYPSGTDERRWSEGVLARKKGLGL